MKQTINSHEMFVVELGDVRGLPVVFLHAYPVTHRMWEPQLQVMPASFRVIAYDLRGMGESELGNGSFDFECLVDDLIGLMDALNIERAVLCGLSMGGYLALRTVQRNPERVAGLVLCDTRSAADSEQDRQNRQKVLELLGRGEIDAFVSGFLTKFLCEHTHKERPQVVRFLSDLIKANSAAGLEAATRALMSRRDTTDYLPQIAVPTLILHGEEDGGISVETAQQMQAKIPGAELAIIPQAGHFSNLENPELFNHLLLEFLRKKSREGDLYATADS